MKFHLKNIGLIDDATIELSDITCICGLNNTGKTYVTYAIYGFLHSFDLLARRVLIERLMGLGSSYDKIELTSVFDGGVKSFLKKMSHIYMSDLPDVFGTRNIISENSYFEASMSNVEFEYESFEMQRLLAPRNKTKTGASQAVNIVKLPGETTINFVVDASEESHSNIDKRNFLSFIVETLVAEVVSKVSPTVYIASAERTGAAIFRDELDFAKLRLFDLLKNRSERGEKENLTKALMNEALGGNYSYAWPIEHNVDFVRQIEKFYKEVGEIAHSNPRVIEMFENIIGGCYKVVKDVLVYQSNGKGKPKFAMSESSSSVRALLDIGFYIRCKLKRGDILIIDEPELNLHPKNQRRLARLLAYLSNVGVKVFITTHSDFIIKELNILLMFKGKGDAGAKLAQKYGYEECEFLNHDDISVYTTANLKVSRKNINTLEKAVVSEEFGIELPTFDNSITEMAEIQSELYFGVE